MRKIIAVDKEGIYVDFVKVYLRVRCKNFRILLRKACSISDTKIRIKDRI